MTREWENIIDIYDHLMKRNLRIIIKLWKLLVSFVCFFSFSSKNLISFFLSWFLIERLFIFCFLFSSFTILNGQFYGTVLVKNNCKGIDLSYWPMMLTRKFNTFSLIYDQFPLLNCRNFFTHSTGSSKTPHFHKSPQTSLTKMVKKQ